MSENTYLYKIYVGKNDFMQFRANFTDTPSFLKGGNTIITNL